MPLNYMPTFIRLCRKLSVYVAEHDHHMLVALEKSEHISEEEKQQVRDLFKQLKNMSAIFQKLHNKF
jgi:hypothetical protein